jgi:spore germination cell wall hydrolase CwlJ-like protein
LVSGYETLKYRRQLQRVVVVCGLFACMSAVIVFKHHQAQIQAEQIKSLKTQIQTQETRILNLTVEIERLEQEVDNVRLENATSRGADMQRLRLDELRDIAGTVHAEAQGESPRGKMLVARVVLNRMRWNPELTAHEVLTNPNAFATGTEYTSADMAAVYQALQDTEYTHLSGFHNPATATNPEADTRKILLKEGNHVFW